MEHNFFGRSLIQWYQENKRELPWRETKDPYLVWISEVILQQTRVAQGLDYYFRFTSRFPDISSLAYATEDEVMTYWQGLGYYSRARNLHAAAKEIVAKFRGEFPSAHNDILSLRGIGEYTASAISSFVWGQPYAVLDGNVFRVLSRFFGVDTAIDSTEGKKFFKGFAQELLDKTAPGTYNQAIMDFGAIQCLPKSPHCMECPLNDKCVALASGRINDLPVKQHKTKTQDRYFNYINIRYKGSHLLQQRVAKDIWQNLYEFPLIETEEAVDYSVLQTLPVFMELFGEDNTLQIRRQMGPVKHVLSHRVIHASFYEIEAERLSEKMKDYLLVPETMLEKYAVSRLIRIYLEKR